MAKKLSAIRKTLRLTLRFQFWLNLTGLVFLLSVLCILLFVTYKNLTTYKVINQHLKKIELYTSTLHVEEKSYLESITSIKNLNATASINNKIYALYAIIDSCSKAVKWNNIDNYINEIDTLKNHLAFYQSVINSSFVLSNKKGFKNTGAIGEMNNAFEAMKKISDNVGNYGFTAYLLELKHYEKLFFLDHEAENIANFNASAERLKQLLDYNITEDEYLKADIAKNLNVYQSKFNEAASFSQKLGLSEQEGLRRDLGLAFKNLSSKLTEISTVVNEKLDYCFRIITLEFFVFGLIVLLLFLGFQIKLLKSIFNPVRILKRHIKSMSQGEIPEKITEIKGNNEFTDIVDLLNHRIETLNETEQFARHIKDGNYDSDYQPVSDKDVLGIALLEMRENLKKNKEESEERAKLEQQQSWISSGTAKIAQVLNQNYQNSDDFAYSIIKTLVDYMEANQGGLFMVNDESHKPYLELKGLVAYNRRKFADKIVKFGEGFVGTSILEKKHIYRTEIPSDYIEITSGLGGANPNVLLIVPLMVDEEVYGVIEIASFKEFQEYQIDFVKRISETIATTISGVKSKERTEKLLKMTQEQSEKIAQTEEEMRQNIEELKATHEEMERQQSDLKENEKMLVNIIDIVPFPIFVKNENREYIIINKEQCNVFGLERDRILHRRDKDLLSDPDDIKTIQESDSKVIHNNEKVVLTRQRLTFKNGESKNVKTIKVPFTNNKTNVTNILGVSIDLSEHNGNDKQLQEALKTIEDLKQKLEGKK